MPSIAGLGLVALDVVMTGADDVQVGEWAGGTCGNVTAILAYLGWDARPIARLDNSDRSDRIRSDLISAGVDDRWLNLKPAAAAPVFVQRLAYAPDGTATHQFERFCPGCGQPLPGYQAVTISALAPILPTVAQHDVVFIDRPSAGAVLVAEHAAKAGALVYFEPSARGHERHLQRIAQAASIVKYSRDRLAQRDRDIIAGASPRVEIETCGSHGLRFRCNGHPWRALSAPTAPVKDSAGAGDWTTAGVLHSLVDHRDRYLTLEPGVIGQALKAGQALGAMSCSFVGARGAMMHLKPTEALAAAARLGTTRHAPRQRRLPSSSRAPSAFSCGSCRPS